MQHHYSGKKRHEKNTILESYLVVKEDSRDKLVAVADYKLFLLVLFCCLVHATTWFDDCLRGDATDDVFNPLDPARLVSTTTIVMRVMRRSILHCSNT